MNKGVKFRAYPTAEQKKLISQTFGCSRLVYNKSLDAWNKAYENKEKCNYYTLAHDLTALKKQEDYAFLKDVDSMALQQSLRDLDRGFTNFFAHRAKHPQFKSKHNNNCVYRTLNQKDNICIVGNRLKLPKLGYVKIKQSMPVGEIKNVTVERTPTGRYFVVLNTIFEPEVKFNAGGQIGIDVGISEFYTDSNNNVVENPKHLERAQKKLCREQRKLSRKQKGSRNRDKQRVKVARVYENITNRRNDFLQKETTRLVNENQVICVEDLNVKGMLRNHKLARHISSVSWSKFFTMLEYKSSWYGNEVIKVPTFYPSSQICSNCGYQNSLVKNLSVREWICPICGTHLYRDENAAGNILAKGLEIRNSKAA